MLAEYGKTYNEINAERWLWLDFSKKKAYFGDSHVNAGREPAPIWVYEVFMKHFKPNGVKECTFKELQSYTYFNGCRKKGVVYAFVPITSKYLFRSILLAEKGLKCTIENILLYLLDEKIKNEKLELTEFQRKKLIDEFSQSVANQIKMMIK